MDLASGHLWFRFGEHHDGRHVDIADVEEMTLIAKVPSLLAETIIEKHNAAIWAMEARANVLFRSYETNAKRT